MIYLIGGPPRCGKTTVARRLARSVGCSWVAGDWLSQAFSAYIAEDDIRPEEQLDLGPNVPSNSRNDVRYARYSATEIIIYYRAWAARTWPGLQVFVD
jgi:2-phosphoglycerate kinase